MQVSEFKAWFEGFTGAVAKLPTEKQWARIKARVDEIDGTETVVQSPGLWTTTNIPPNTSQAANTDIDAQARQEADGQAFLAAMGRLE